MPDSIVLRSVVIQATRASKHAPVPHSNVSASEIKRIYHAQDVPFLLSGLPSVVETSDAGAGIGYTTMRVRGSDPTRTNVTINGIPFNDAESQGVFWVNLPDLAASASEIQVQRGLGTSSNGAGAFGATVNLDISRVEAEPFAMLTNSLGSFGTRKHAVQAGTGLLNRRWAFSGRISSLVSDGFIDRARADLNAFHLSGAYVGQRQTWQAHVLSGHEITYQAWNGVPAQYLDNEALRTFNTAGTEKTGAPYENEVDDYTQRHFLLQHKRIFDKGLSLQVNGHYTRGFGFFEQYKAGQAFADYGLPDLNLGDTVLTKTDLVRRRWLDNHFYGGTFALRFAPPVNPPFFSRPPVFTLGGAASRYEGKHFGEIIWAEYAAAAEKGFRYYDNDALKNDANIYFQSELAFAGGWTTFLDLQWRHVGYRFLGFNNDLQNVEQTAKYLFFNPKAGLRKAFDRRLSAYVFAGRGHREPNRDDFTQSTPDSRPKPERLFDLETGIASDGEKWLLAANVFYMFYWNQLVLDGRINDVGAYIRTNVPRSFRAGVELEASRKWAERWRFSGNLTLSRNKIRAFTEFLDNWDTGEQTAIEHRNTDLAFSPKLVGRAEASFLYLKNKNWENAAALVGKYVGKQFLDNTGNENTALPGYFTLDARLNFSLKNWLGADITGLVSVNNLLDARFASNGWAYRYISQNYDDRPYNAYTRLEGRGVYNQTGFFPQAGRHFMATLNLRF